MKAFIAYGWPEGKWHGKQLREALVKYGYNFVNSPDDADVIVAHSAGCYMLPANLNARVVLLVGLPHWPGKFLFKCVFAKVSLEAKDKYWFQKTLRHVRYAIFQPIRLYEVMKSYKRKVLPLSTNGSIILVHNEHDTFMNEAEAKSIAKERQWSLMSLAGQHDDLWQNPETYIELIVAYLPKN